MRTAAICPTCATYENAVCVIYNGDTLNNINVPPLTNLEVALGNIDSSVEYLQSQITYLSTNPINLTTNGSSGPATFESNNVLNIPIYQPTLQDVLSEGNTGTSWINLNSENSDIAVDIYTLSSQVTLLAASNGYPYLKVTDNVTKTVDVYKDNITFTNITDGYSLSINPPASISEDQSISLPDATGTIALLSDVTLQTVTAGDNKNLTSNLNFQGTSAGEGHVDAGSTDINAFGENAASLETVESAIQNVNAFGNSAANGNSANNVNAFGNSAGSNNEYSNVNLFGHSALASANNQVVFSKNGGAQLARIGYGGITANRLYTLPDKDGTLATTDDVAGPIQRVKVSLTSANILALSYATPFTLIAAPGAGKYIDVISLTGHYIFNTAAYSGNTSVYYRLGAQGVGIYSAVTNVLNQVENTYHKIPPIFNTIIYDIENKPLIIDVGVGTATGGQGTLDIYITYSIVTL